LQGGVSTKTHIYLFLYYHSSIPPLDVSKDTRNHRYKRAYATEARKAPSGQAHAWEALEKLYSSTYTYFPFEAVKLHNILAEEGRFRGVTSRSQHCQVELCFAIATETSVSQALLLDNIYQTGYYANQN
jgi:hypothetical protein